MAALSVDVSRLLPLVGKHWPQLVHIAVREAISDASHHSSVLRDTARLIRNFILKFSPGYLVLQGEEERSADRRSASPVIIDMRNRLPVAPVCSDDARRPEQHPMTSGC
jgi:hypothetical protein